MGTKNELGKRIRFYGVTVFTVSLLVTYSVSNGNYIYDLTPDPGMPNDFAYYGNITTIGGTGDFTSTTGLVSDWEVTLVRPGLTIKLVPSNSYIWLDSSGGPMTVTETSIVLPKSSGDSESSYLKFGTSTLTGIDFQITFGAASDASGPAQIGMVQFDPFFTASIYVYPESEPYTTVASRVPPAPFGDLDGDGFVGINDLNIVLGNWNLNVPLANPLADPSGDGFVGIDDLNQVLGNWNAGSPPESQVIPEPASIVLLCISGATLIRRTEKARKRG